MVKTMKGIGRRKRKRRRRRRRMELKDINLVNNGLFMQWGKIQEADILGR